ncbi:MAG: phage baseplate assembly protein [Herbaspirillum sp.]|uniref:phage baseplate assembly protein V n=1 Tax=Herbaspirillum sp. TaxID=1890675 RepID=UPI00258F706B|nr:phage baseplate assembly protein V [Herbaspirillum sp.]MCP3653320.1 phage baseplate assembly protein [Herbaspirillum sp.]MCP3946733.1 phage baseplate assembly protein [Herbaspirillum sp.]MCP4031209.1 phage baseplate assembly protein [Herbaspirillum sp.]MCP4554354.1 phage baseplate assembly protein [Herbaspirillum sp.]
MKGKINLMLGRGIVSKVTDGGAIQLIRGKLMDGEDYDQMENLQPYGFTSVPKAGAELLSTFIGGNRDHPVIVVVGDRRYRLRGLQDGEMAIYDDQGQKVHLTRAGIVIDGGNKPITIQNTPEIDMNTPLVKMAGDLKVTGSVSADGDISDHGNKKMSSMRAVYNNHDHSNPEGGRVGKDQGQM